jgi:nitrous oxide reductase accessory protein NosL
VLPLFLGAALVISAVAGCESKRGGTAARAAASAAPIGLSECAACGMVVREQPAPRGQVVHRDGTRVFLCSLGDLAQYLQSPSPHGDATDVFVEVLTPSEEPTKKDTAEHAWVRAADAHYVVGVARPGVMGRPVLAYRSPADAEAAQKRLGGQTLGLEAMKKWVLER